MLWFSSNLYHYCSYINSVADKKNNTPINQRSVRFFAFHIHFSVTLTFLLCIFNPIDTDDYMPYYIRTLVGSILGLVRVSIFKKTQRLIFFIYIHLVMILILLFPFLDMLFLPMCKYLFILSFRFNHLVLLWI